ncbi:MAG: hypothetical protein ACK4FP_04890 [Azonexus sp.]
MSLTKQVLQLIVEGKDTLDQLATATGKTRREVVKMTQVLKHKGLIDVCDALDAQLGTGARGLYLPTEAGIAFAAADGEIKPGKAGPRPCTRTVGLRERAWWHFRVHRVATIKDLLTTHATGKEKAAQDNLYKWVVALELAGILQRLPAKQPAKQSKGRVVWSLANDLGPAAPVWRQIARTVFDPNSGQVFPVVKVASHD